MFRRPGFDSPAEFPAVVFSSSLSLLGKTLKDCFSSLLVALLLLEDEEKVFLAEAISCEALDMRRLPELGGEVPVLVSLVSAEAAAEPFLLSLLSSDLPNILAMMPLEPEVGERFAASFIVRVAREGYCLRGGGRASGDGG